MANITSDEIKAKIRSTLDELMEEDISTISDDSLFIEELGVNSIVIVQVFLTCQETYGIDLTEEMKLAEPMSIQMLADKICSKVNQQ